MHNLILQLQMQAYLSKSGREIWHVDYFNWIVSPDQSRDQSLFISFSQMVFFMQAKYEYLCFYFFSAPLLHYFSLWGKCIQFFPLWNYMLQKLPFDQVAIPIKCLFFKRGGLYTVAWNILLWVLLILFIYYSYFMYGFKRGVFCVNTWCRSIWGEKNLILS